MYLIEIWLGESWRYIVFNFCKTTSFNPRGLIYGRSKLKTFKNVWLLVKLLYLVSIKRLINILKNINGTYKNMPIYLFIWKVDKVIYSSQKIPKRYIFLAKKLKIFKLKFEKNSFFFAFYFPLNFLVSYNFYCNDYFRI